MHSSVLVDGAIFAARLQSPSDFGSLAAHFAVGFTGSRIRVNPGVMARLRSQALNIARANGVKNIAQACWTGALDPAVILSYRGL